MLETWKHWEGQVVDAALPLRAFLGGSSRSAVYLVDYPAGSAGSEGGKAALKLIPADPQDADSQLVRWKLAAELSHPHLIRLLQMGRCELDGLPLLYVVTELADENIAEILPGRSLTVEETSEAVAPVLDALAYLHEHGFVHAAIKPSNIMAVGNQLKISSDCLVPIGEYNNATAVPTPYDPPEIERGVISPPETMSPAADVCSLGMTLVEVLTQVIPPQEWGSPDGPPLPPGLPQPFLDIARHCLRREAKRRWTVAQIAARLRLPASAVLPEEISEPVAAAASPKRSKAGRYLVVALGAALLAAIFLVPRLLHHGDGSEAAPAGESAPSSSSPAPSPSVPAAQVSPPSPAPSQASAPAVPPAPVSSSPTPKPLAPAASAAAAPSSPAPQPAPPEPNTTPQSDSPGVVKRVLPNLAPAARSTIQGTIRVVIRLTVDSSGNVTAATFDYRGPSGYFADKAMESAHGWKFDPAAANVPGEWLLRFAITRAATNAIAGPATP